MLYRQIQTFLEVANCLNFTTAAKNLGLTQQAVTKQIASLESELNIELFYRTTRTVSLTKAGQTLRNDFTDINRHIQETLTKVRALKSGKIESCTLGFLSVLPRQSITVPIVRELTKNFPNVYFDIKLLDFVELRNKLLDGKLDFCILTSNDWALWPGVRATVLEQNNFNVAFSMNHPLANLEEFSEDDLGNFIQLTLPDDYLIGNMPFWGKMIPCLDTILCPDIGTLLLRLETGEGFALLTRMFEGSDSPSLCFKPISSKDAHAELVCLCRENASYDIKCMIQHIEHCFSEISAGKPQ
ncbi:MAG: LysR family transcriptional regulator [Spirochaetales bacterium]|nr:LysR family transcriptional regulator [Spirochaetales bacterium]